MPEGVKDIDRYNDLMRNGEFDLKLVESHIIKALGESYDSLRITQLLSVGLNRQNLTSDNIVTPEKYKGKLVITVGQELVKTNSRKIYHNSSLYNKELTLKEINDNRKIFEKIPLLFMDGIVNFDYTLIADGDKTHFLFKENHPVKTSKDITTMFIWNNGYSVIETNKHVVGKYNGILPFKFFKDHLDDLNKPPNRAFYSSSDKIDSMGRTIYTREKGVDLNLNPETSNIVMNSNTFQIHIMNMKFIHDMEREYTIDVPFVIENGVAVFNMPIPVENILVFKKVGDVYKLSNKAYAELHFPNIYVIKDSDNKDGDLYRITFFFDEYLNDPHYTNELESIVNVLVSQKYYNETNIEDILKKLMKDPAPTGIPKLVKEYLAYNPNKIEYCHHDFFAKEPPYHFDYKVDKFSQIFYGNNKSIDVSKYFNDVRTDIDSYYLYAKHIPDLDGRIRTDNSKEKDKISKYQQFTEPHYVFAIDNPKSKHIYNYRVFIDGLLWHPMNYGLYYNIQYIYIPVRLVSLDTYIFIENFDSYGFEKVTGLITGSELMFNSGIDSTDLKPKTYDVCIINKATREIIPDGWFYFSIDGVEYPGVVNGHDYTNGLMLIGDTKLIKTDINTLVDGIELEVYIHKKDKLIFYDMKTSPMPGTCKIIIPFTFHFTHNNVRVFIDGRKSPDVLYAVDYGDKYGDDTVFNNTVLQPDSKEIAFDIIPYQYKELSYIAKLSDMESTIYIELPELVGKQPFSLKYFDVYLNGRRLGYHNVVIISPTKFKLVNIKSFKNFFVYAKDMSIHSSIHPSKGDDMITVRDKIINSPDLSADERLLIINEIFKEQFPTDIPIKPNEDTEPDITIGEPIDIGALDFIGVYTYWMTLNKIGKWNPDILQIDSVLMKRTYPLFTAYEKDSENNFVIKSYNGNPEGDTQIRPGQIMPE